MSLSSLLPKWAAVVDAKRTVRLAAWWLTASQLLTQCLCPPCFPYPGTLEHRGQELWIKLTSWMTSKERKAFVMLSQWPDEWHHRWRSALIVVTEGEGRTRESEGFAGLKYTALRLPTPCVCAWEEAGLPRQWLQGSKAFHGHPKDVTSRVSE